MLGMPQTGVSTIGSDGVTSCRRMDTMMRKLLVSAGCMTLLGLSTVAPTGAASNVTHVAYLTFSRPVQLPGVVLNAGTYIFEQPNPLGAWDFVRVSSRDRKI